MKNALFFYCEKNLLSFKKNLQKRLELSENSVIIALDTIYIINTIQHKAMIAVKYIRRKVLGMGFPIVFGSLVLLGLSYSLEVGNIKHKYHM